MTEQKTSLIKKLIDLIVARVERPLYLDPHHLDQSKSDELQRIRKMSSLRLSFKLALTEKAWSAPRGIKTHKYMLYQGKEFIKAELKRRKTSSEAYM